MKKPCLVCSASAITSCIEPLHSFIVYLFQCVFQSCPNSKNITNTESDEIIEEVYPVNIRHQSPPIFCMYPPCYVNDIDTHNDLDDDADNEDSLHHSGAPHPPHVPVTLVFRRPQYRHRPVFAGGNKRRCVGFNSRGGNPVGIIGGRSPGGGNG